MLLNVQYIYAKGYFPWHQHFEERVYGPTHNRDSRGHHAGCQPADASDRKADGPHSLAVPNPNYQWYVEIPNPSNRRTYSFPVKVAYGLWKGESATERQTHEGVKFFRDLDFSDQAADKKKLT